MVMGMEEVRAGLPSIVAAFRTETDVRPVHFGSHRRDEAVVVSAAEYRRLEAQDRRLDELERRGAVRLVTDRTRDGRFTEGTVDELFAAADALT